MAVIKMNCGETIALLSSASFRRSPAGLKYPSSSVLRFPAKNSYNGVITAARSNNNNYSSSNNNNNNENLLKIKEEGNGEVSMMLDNLKFIGQKEDVEAAVVQAIRNASRRKIIKFAQITIGFTLVFFYIFKSNFGRVTRYLKTSWASGLTTWDHPLYVVTFAVIISKPISDKIKDRLKVLIQQERMKLNFVRNQEIKELLKALHQEIKVNPGRINALDSETKNLVIKASNLIKSRTNDTEMKVITQLIEEEEAEESGNIEKYGGTENGQHMRED